MQPLVRRQKAEVRRQTALSIMMPFLRDVKMRHIENRSFLREKVFSAAASLMAGRGPPAPREQIQSQRFRRVSADLPLGGFARHGTFVAPGGRRGDPKGR